MKSDLKLACIQLLKNPGYTLVSVLTLAVGIGANTALFGMLNELLLRPLPVQEPEQLLGVVLIDHSGDFADQSIPYPILQDYRVQMDGVFREFAAYAPIYCLLEGSGGPEYASIELATPGYFSTLGIKPSVGRFYEESVDPSTDQGPVAVLSHVAWQGWFNGDPSVIGQTVILRPAYADPVHATVIGVAPEGFRGIGRATPQLWLPAVLEKHFKDAAPVNFRMVGRLAEGVQRRQAESALDVVAKSIASQHGGRPLPGYENEGLFRSDLRTELRHAALGSWGAFRSHSPLRKARLLAFGVSALVLLIACANIANLTLARAESRRRVTAIRLSLGAGRVCLLRSALLESLLLSAAGGVAGLILAHAANRLLLAFRPPNIELLVRTNPDLRVVGFCFAAALISGLLVGLLPAWRISQQDPNLALRDLRGQPHASGARIRNAFAIVQVALSLVLVIGAGLCLRSFAGLLTADPGFQADRLVVARLDFSSGHESEGSSRYRLLVDRLTSLPGVESVSWSRVFPLLPMGGGISAPVEQIEGYEPRENEFLRVEFTEVAPGFFETMGMGVAKPPARPLDAAGTLVWVNESFAQRYWSDQEPIGRRVGNWEIDGIVKDAQVKNLWDPPTPFLYLQRAEPDVRSGIITIRTKTRPGALLNQVRNVLLAMDPELDLLEVTTMRDALGQSLRAQKFMVLLLGICAVCAVLLALIGIYGVISYLVSQRTREIGIRMALGAEPQSIVAVILRHGSWLTALGLGLGLMGAWGATRMLGSVIYNVSPTDPLTFAVVAALLATAALIACWLPARRASRIDPMNALRTE